MNQEAFTWITNFIRGEVDRTARYAATRIANIAANAAATKVAGSFQHQVTQAIAAGIASAANAGTSRSRTKTKTEPLPAYAPLPPKAERQVVRRSDKAKDLAVRPSRFRWRRFR